MPVTIQDNGLRWIEVDGLKFGIRPQSFTDVLLGGKAAESLSLPEDLAGYAEFGFRMLRRIEAWEGIELPDGSAAPCNDDTKEILFGLRPDLPPQIARELVEQEAAARKNLQTSQDGSASTMNNSATPVENP